VFQPRLKGSPTLTAAWTSPSAGNPILASRMVRVTCPAGSIRRVIVAAGPESRRVPFLRSFRRVDIPRSRPYIRYMSLPVWPVPVKAQAATAKERIDEETTGQSLPRLRASGPARAPPPLPLPGAPQLLIRSFPGLLTVLP
jgi:hypothetical protein